MGTTVTFYWILAPISWCLILTGANGYVAVSQGMNATVILVKESK